MMTHTGNIPRATLTLPRKWGVSCSCYPTRKLYQTLLIMKKSIITMMVLMQTCAAWAQDVCYLVGTDGKKEANKASVTLTKESNGVFKGEVTFTEEGREFFIATELGNWDEPDKVESFCYGPKAAGSPIVLGTAQEFDMWKTVGPMVCFVTAEATAGGSTGGFAYNKAYLVTVDFNQLTLLVSEISNDEPENPEDEDDGTTPAEDINLNSGTHFTVNVPEAGALETVLRNAINQTDYDLVDFLTVKGKIGGKDIKYLKDQAGFVSQLQYLDLSEVELVYDDEAYSSVTVSDKGPEDIAQGIVNYTTYYYTLSAENKEDDGGSDPFTGTSTHHYYYQRRNDLSFAFNSMKSLKQIKLPKTLKGLGEGILENCEVLEKVTFPDAATYIGAYALLNETSGYNTMLRRTLKGVDLPASITKLGKDALRGVGFRTISVGQFTELGEGCLRETNITEVALNNSVKEVPAQAFSGCNRIESATIPSTVEAIGDEAFKSCEKLSSVAFAGQVESIGKEAFSGCKKLTTVCINAKHIGESAFASCNLTSVEIADGAKSIGQLAFSGNHTLTSVTAPQTLEEIGSHAFNGYGEFGVGVYDTPYITNLPVEDGVKYVGSVAYIYMGGNELKVKEGTLGIAGAFLKNHRFMVDKDGNDWGASSNFSGWTTPTTISLPSTLRVIGKQSFKDNKEITTIELPASLEKIGYEAFSGCSKLKGRITIPASTKLIGGYAFKGTAFTRVNYNAVEAENIEPGNAGEISGRIFPDNLTRVIIGEGVESIPSGLFAGCANVARLQMASTVKRIGAYAFEDCTSLKTIDLPSALQEVSDYAFNHVQPEVLSVYMPTPVTLGQFAFGESHTQMALLKVPNGSLAAYQGDAAWANSFQKIEQFDGASDTETVSETTTVTVSDAVTDDTDLTGTMLGDVYVTLDTDDSGDGYNASEGCLVINSTVSDEQLAAVTADNADDLTVKNQFNGLIFEVPAGKGSVVIDCQTLGQNIIYIKIGANDPQQVEAASKQQLSVPYTVTEATRIYVYAAPTTGAAAKAQERDGVKSPRRANAYANTDAVKIYGLTIKVDENLTGIATPLATLTQKDGACYTLDGRRLNGLPTQKGLYIVNRKKVVIK